MLKTIMAAAAFSLLIATSFSAHALPEKLVVRAICETEQVKTFREARKHRTNKPSWVYDATESKKDKIPGVKYAGPGLHAIIQIDGVRQDLDLSKHKFPVLDHRNVATDRTLEATSTPGTLRFSTLDMGNGQVTIQLGDIVDPDMKKPLVVTIFPQNFEGAGLTYNAQQKYFTFDYRYRKDNATVIPEIGVVPRHGVCS